MIRIKTFLLFLVVFFIIQSIYAQTCPTTPTYNSNTDMTMGTGETCDVAGPVTVPSNRSPDVIMTGDGKMTINGDFILLGQSGINMNTSDTLKVLGDLTLDGNADIVLTSGVLYVTGNLTISGNALFGAGGNVIVGGNLTVSGANADVTVGGGFSVGGTADLGSENITVGSGAVFTADSLTSTGSLIVQGGGTVFVDSGLDDITVDATGATGDVVCTDNCCGELCNPGTDNLSDSALAILPVILVEFKGYQEANAINLSWTTASEINFEEFELYKVSGYRKEIVSVLQSSGQSIGNTYRFTDLNPEIGYNVYQIRSVDFDGYKEWFSPVVVLFEPEGLNLSIYPSIGRSADFKVDISQEFDLSIYRLDGVLVLKSTVRQGDLSALSYLNNGLFILRMNLNGLVTTQKIRVFN